MVKKFNNKGFTLVELIIAISIFTVVIGIGYGVLNKTNASITEQQVVTDGQMNANLVNKYLTKDLEQCTKLIEPSTFDVSEYEYTISEKDNSRNVIYRVIKYNKNTKQYYDLVRIANNQNITITSKQEIYNEDPFTISLGGINDNIYEVWLDYDENNRFKTYKFSVASRILMANGNQGGEGGETSNKDTGYIRFGFTLKNDGKDEIRTSVDPKKNGAHNQESTPISIDKKDKYEIDCKIDRQSGRTYSQIDENSSKATSNHNIFKTKSFNSIEVIMGENMAVDLYITINYKNNRTPLTVNLTKDIDGIREKNSSVVTSEKSGNSVIYRFPAYNTKKQESITISGSIGRLNQNAINEEVTIRIGEDLKRFNYGT